MTGCHPVDQLALREFLGRHGRLFVLTGAGCSTESGIPDYRDARGDWKRDRPVEFRDFVGDEGLRRRYWARSLIGWRRMSRAVPNDAHRALADLERQGRVELLVTQNVDGLHQAAGSRKVVDLHGRLDLVLCLDCGRRFSRAALQDELVSRNPGFASIEASRAPDGDADVEDVDFSTFDVPACRDCGGILKPDVVFFGENVPRARVRRAMAGIDSADAMLVVGSSLMVYSGYRFVRAMAGAGKPVAAVNLGVTRADELLSVKTEAACSAALAFLLEGAADPTVSELPA